MNRTFRIAIVTAFLLLLVVIYVLFIKRGKDKVLYKIPNTATSVIVVDFYALFSKLLPNNSGWNIKNSNSPIAKFIPDSLKDIDWTSAGLGLPDKAALFTIEDTARAKISINFILPIANSRKFSLFMHRIGDRMNVDINRNDAIRWIYFRKLGLLLAWNKTFVTGARTAGDHEIDLMQLINILAVPVRQSMMADTCFAKISKRKCEVLFYSKPYRKYGWEKLDTLNAEINYGASFLSFNDGELDISTEIATKPGAILNRMFTPSDRKIFCLSNANNAILQVVMNVNPEAAKTIYNTFKPVEFKTGTWPYADAWDGHLHMLLCGTKIIESKCTTYEYDDNFNKIEAKKTVREEVFDVQAVAGIREAIIASVNKHSGLPLNDPKDSLVYKKGNFEFEKSGDNYLVYNKYFGKPQIKPQINLNNIEITANYKKLAPILRNMGMGNKISWLDRMGCEKIILSANKTDKIYINSTIYFTNKSRNSFYSIMAAY